MGQQWLENLRERPNKDKKKIAFTGAGIITSMIAMIWMVTFVADINPQANTAAAIEAARRETALKQLREGVNNIKEDIDQIQQPPVFEGMDELEKFATPDGEGVNIKALAEQLEFEAERDREFNARQDATGQEASNPDRVGSDSIYNVVE